MICWNCINYGSMTEAVYNGAGPGWDGWAAAWCKAWDEAIEQLQDYEHDFLNCEHYKAEPLKRVFVSHPLYSEGDVAENMCRVEDICRELVSEGMLPISPLHLFGFLDSETPQQRAEIMRVCKGLIDLSDEVWSYGNKGGCKIEKEYAKALGKSVVEKGGH